MKNKVREKSINRLFQDFSEHEVDEVSQDEKEYELLQRKLLEEYLAKDNNPERIKLYAEYIAGKAIFGTNGIRKRLAAVDLSYFGRAYFPHFFSRKSPKFHEDLDEIWESGVLKSINPLQKAKTINRLQGVKRAVAAPRGHAKSTNLTFKDVLHAVLYAYKHFIVIISDTYDQSKGFLEAIKEELEENEAILNDFGSLAGKIWREDVIVTKSKIKVQAKGAAQKMRGLKHKQWRPDLIVLDDTENDELVRTAEQRKKLKDWYYKAVSKAGDSYTDFIFIGTMLHYDSLLADVLKNPSYHSIKYQAVESFSASPLWEIWETIYTNLSDKDREQKANEFFAKNQSEMLAGTKVLWEEKLPYVELMKIKISEGEAAFFSELQNEPINPEDCLFNEEWFEYFNPLDFDFRESKYWFYGFVDPSLGKTKKSDYSAIITLVLDIETGYMYVLDADVERRHPDKIIGDTLNKAVWIWKEFGKKYKDFGAETNQFQWFLKEALAKESARCGIYLPITEVQQSADKTMRVQTLQPDIKNKYIKFQAKQKLLLEQLKYFPMAAHDDAPDALEGARTLATKRKRKNRLLDIRKFGLF